MTPHPHRRTSVLVGVLLLLSFGMWQRIAPWTQKTALGVHATTRTEARDATSWPQVVTLDLDRLGAHSSSFRSTRNLFQFDAPPAQTTVSEASRVPGRVPSTHSERPVDTRPASLELIGIFGQRQRPIAVLSDGRTVFNAHVHDRLPDGRSIASIGVDPHDDRPMVVLADGTDSPAAQTTLRPGGPGR